jgi:hypothetical protein
MLFVSWQFNPASNPNAVFVPAQVLVVLPKTIPATAGVAQAGAPLAWKVGADAPFDVKT